MAVNPSIQLGTSGNWAIKEDNLLAYKQLGNKFFNREFDFSRGTTATFIGEDGLIQESAIDVPRIDFTDDTTGHLLLEPQSTNLLPYSEDFSNSYWAKSDVTVEGGFTSPSGDESAYKLKEGSATINHQMYGAISGTAGNIYTLSGIFKKGERDIIQLVYGGAAFDEGNTYCNFDLSNGVLGSGLYLSASITLISNGWYRCEFTATKTTTGNFNITYAPKLTSTASRNASYTGDGTSGVYLWGAQLEVQSFATSYIPTSGSTVTRNQEICNNSGTAIDFNSEEGVLYAEIAALAENYTSRRFITLNDSTASNGAVLRYEASGVIVARYQIAGVAQCSIAFAATITNYHKIAFKYSLNDFALWVDGVEVGVDSSGNVLSDGVLNNIDFNSGNGTFPFFGKTKNLKVFKRALTDAELQELTT